MDLSLLICAYNMDRELPRTIHTLGQAYQRDLEGIDYELIVIDNGSANPVEEDALRQITGNVRVIRTQNPSQSPAGAINAAAAGAKGQIIGLFIDGARMASPGLLAGALRAYRADPTKAVGSVAFHLGPDVQTRSVLEGYDQAVEDEILASIPWREDGYTLFSQSVLAMSSAQGWFGVLAESNGVFLDRALWDRLGGLDERFATPGGGLVNLDFWKRAVEASDNAPWIVLGEGTFHQVHGGAATNGSQDDRQKMHAEYEALFGAPYVKPAYTPRLIGSVDRALAKRFAGRDDPAPRPPRPAAGQPIRFDLPASAPEHAGAGAFSAEYRGLRIARPPSDMMLYEQLIDRLLPGTIIEIGSFGGGSALWLKDYCRRIRLDCEVLTIDTAPPREIEGVTAIRADATRPDDTFPHTKLALAYHPWLVIENCASPRSSTWSVLEYFGTRLQRGDYAVVENGLVAAPPAGRAPQYPAYPNQTLRDFLKAHPEMYQMDEELADWFGATAASCASAWLLKT